MMKKRLFSLFGALLLSTQAALAEPLLKAEKLADGVFGLIGSTAGRLHENLGLNANYGVIDTPDGAILIDSGASASAAKLLSDEVKKLTGKPVRWVINTGSQDHRWLGNAYFAAHGAEIIALERTVATQRRLGLGQIEALRPALREQVDGLEPMSAERPQAADQVALQPGGRRIELRYFADAHFAGDSVVWLPKEKILFSGDHIYVDRLLGILPESNSETWLAAFRQAIALQPQHIVPGHGRVCDSARAQRDTGDYLAFVVKGTEKLAADMAGVDVAVKGLGAAPEFEHLLNFSDLHKGNVSRAYLRFESGQ
jgi:glyoxylase-like metal-dependent hydrolase (beta-lactamase superfamily II)